jgi:hypothetical protein
MIEGIAQAVPGGTRRLRLFWLKQPASRLAAENVVCDEALRIASLAKGDKPRDEERYEHEERDPEEEIRLARQVVFNVSWIQ